MNLRHAYAYFHESDSANAKLVSIHSKLEEAAQIQERNIFTCPCGCFQRVTKKTFDGSSIFFSNGSCHFESIFNEKVAIAFLKNATDSLHIYTPSQNPCFLCYARQKISCDGASKTFSFRSHDNEHLVNSHSTGDKNIIVLHSEDGAKKAFKIWPFNCFYTSIKHDTQANNLPDTWKNLPLGHLFAGNIVTSYQHHENQPKFVRPLWAIQNKMDACEKCASPPQAGMQNVKCAVNLA